jgi:hypothetical protein
MELLNECYRYYYGEGFGEVGEMKERGDPHRGFERKRSE